MVLALVACSVTTALNGLVHGYAALLGVRALFAVSIAAIPRGDNEDAGRARAPGPASDRERHHVRDHFGEWGHGTADCRTGRGTRGVAISVPASRRGGHARCTGGLAGSPSGAAGAGDDRARAAAAAGAARDLRVVAVRSATGRMDLVG